MKIRSMSIILIAIVMAPDFCFASELSLREYLKQVEDNNQNVIASKLILEGSTERADEGQLIFKPNLFVQGQLSVDKKPVISKVTQGDRTDSELATVGLMKNFDFGLKGQLSYTLNHTKIYNVSSNFLPLSDFNDGITKIELSQSLWRNFWGKENRAQSELIDSQTKVNKHLATFSIQSTLATAESVYWSLSQTKKVLKVQQENLTRAQQLRDWNLKRINIGLAERSDYLQSEANLRLREYEYNNVLQQKVLLQRTFNSLRGMDNPEVKENLAQIETKSLKELIAPEKTTLREDVKAALEQQNIAKASAAMAIERNKPTFEIYGAYAMNAKEPNKTDTISNSFNTDKTSSVIGLRFTTPLAFETTTSAINAYEKERLAAEYNYQRKVFDQNKEWNDLNTKFNDTKIKLSLVEKIADAQKIKTINERNRLNNGRTTTFQVLMFELDSASADLLKIQTETDLLNIYAQMKIFSAGGVE